jgi:hypothetical protein
MSHWQPHPLHYWHPQSQEERWFNETLAKAPCMPHPLPAEIEEGWDIYRILEEIERLRPIIEAARKEWFERRRAERPPEVVAWDAARKAAKDRKGKAPRPTDRPPETPGPSEPQQPSGSPSAQHRPLTPAEKHARKLHLTRLSNQRKRAERKALGLPYK